MSPRLQSTSETLPVSCCAVALLEKYVAAPRTFCYEFSVDDSLHTDTHLLDYSTFSHFVVDRMLLISCAATLISIRLANGFLLLVMSIPLDDLGG